MQRRTVLGGVGSVLGGGLLASTGVLAKTEDPDWTRSNVQADAVSVGLAQDGECVSLSPVVGDVPVTEFYKYGAVNTRYSSAGPVTALERAGTSRLFLYRGPDGVLSLVVVHGKHRLEDVPQGGGSVSFTFEGLPSDGEWVVRDDFYDGPELFDQWKHGDGQATVHWTWQGGRTDGAVFAGLGDDFSITVEPAFNEDAKLYGQHYDADVKTWEALGGSQTDPDAISLAMDEPVVIESDGC